MKTVIVLGLMNSGSGAVHDYLASRKDLEAPFNTSEFKICADPAGLHNLYINFYKNFSFFNPSNAISDFETYIKKIQDYTVTEKHGVPKKLFKNNFYEISLNFLKKVTKLTYYGRPEFSNFRINNFQNFILKFKKKKNNFYPVRIPVNEKKFILESQKYVKKVLLNNIGKKKLAIKKIVVLNQAVNLFNPIESSQYFKNRKIIIVTRDPRDMFSSMKTRRSKGTPSYDVKIFVRWFKECFDQNTFKKKTNNKLILKIKYENFVNNFSKENVKICKFLNIKSSYEYKKNLPKPFNLNSSKKNIYKSKKFLTKFENNFIKRKLKKFLQW